MSGRRNFESKSYWSGNTHILSFCEVSDTINRATTVGCVQIEVLSPSKVLFLFFIFVVFANFWWKKRRANSFCHVRGCFEELWNIVISVHKISHNVALSYNSHLRGVLLLYAYILMVAVRNQDFDFSRCLIFFTRNSELRLNFVVLADDIRTTGPSLQNTDEIRL